MSVWQCIKRIIPLSVIAEIVVTYSGGRLSLCIPIYIRVATIISKFDRNHNHTSLSVQRMSQLFYCQATSRPQTSAFGDVTESCVVWRHQFCVFTVLVVESRSRQVESKSTKIVTIPKHRKILSSFKVYPTSYYRIYFHILLRNHGDPSLFIASIRKHWGRLYLPPPT